MKQHAACMPAFARRLPGRTEHPKQRMITRRRFVIAAGLAAVAPSTGFAQPRQRKVIGYLANNPDPRVVPTFKAFVDALRALKWVEGENLEIRILTAKNNDRVFPLLAQQLAQERVDLIFTTGAASTRAAKEATKTIPIVFGSAPDPVELDFVKNLARPEANLTGMGYFSGELAPKRLQMLKQILPRAKRFARLYSARNPAMAPSVAREPDAVARKLDVMLEHMEVDSALDFERVIKEAVNRLHVDAITIEPDSVFVLEKNRAHLAQLALNHGLPMMGPDGRYAHSGALISYGHDFVRMYARAAQSVHRILSGSKPADIPVELPQFFETTVNHKTARALGITFPPEIMLLATAEIN